MTTLAGLGFDEWVRARREEAGRPELEPARVSRVDRERYLVVNGAAEVQGEPTGNLLFSAESAEHLPCVGDWVLAQYYNEGMLAIIHGVLPRRTFLRRKAAGRKFQQQMIAANIDAAFIVQSCDANFNIRRLERYLVMVNEGGIRPVILLSKSDLAAPEQRGAYVEELRHAGIDAPAILFSNETAEGIESVVGMMEPARTYCMLGSSGVGKTTLLNRLLGSDEYATGEVRESDGRGRHTTTSRQLIRLKHGALLIDTPGMRELGVISSGAGLEASFSEIADLAEQCRFRDCTHTNESGCAVLAAIESGELDAERYQSYIKLVKESAFNEMSYVERRQKDKKFGKMIHHTLKDANRRKGG